MSRGNCEWWIDKEEIKKYPDLSATIIAGIQDIKSEIIVAVQNHRGSVLDDDFNALLDDERTKRIAQIIGLADIYEALTHERIYRQAKLPHQAVRELVESEAQNFVPNIMKALIENIGILILKEHSIERS